MSYFLQLKVYLCLMISVLHGKNINNRFYIGRISEGQFEYSDLNGWMTPKKAEKICESDLKCGGFTYKV